MLKRELVRGIVISNICVKLYRNWIINEVARAGEHTNERTLVGCFGFNGPLRQYFSLYRAVSQREGEREEKG